MISNNRGRKEKQLWTELGHGDPIHVRELDDEHAEARFVAGEIERLVDEGLSRREIAVFYRTNAQSRVLEDTLVRAEIAYQVIGGTKFYERAEIRDAIAYLTALVNQQDAGAFTRIVNSPRRGIGTTSVAGCWRSPTRWESPSGRQRPNRRRWRGSAQPRSRRSVASWAPWACCASGCRVARRCRGCSASFWRRPATSRRCGPSARSRRRGGSRTSRSCVNVAVEYDASDSEQPSVAEFLQQIALVADADTRVEDDGLVTLMTLHNAKGLEYPIVFMIGFEDGVFPHSRALEEGGIEEERRLCYVGITRAQRDLYITYARARTVFGAHGYAIPSRFLAEIPVNLTDAEEQRPRGLGTMRERLTSWPSRGPGRAEAEVVAYKLGDDVVHPKFGDGVVTGLEPGGIVVIRFSADRSERKLVGDLAPITKR